MTEKDMGKIVKLKFYTNFNIKELERHKKALKQSRAVGRIIEVALDRRCKVDNKQAALYFKNDVEYAKYLQAWNYPKENIVDLSDVSTEELMAEIYRRMNGDVIK